MDALNLPDVFEDDAHLRAQAKPRTVTVVALLAVAAATFSYLGAYCLTDALAAANMISAVHTAAHDPRPRWAAVSFAAMVLAFAMIAMVMRIWSGRHFRRIDKMLETDSATGAPLGASAGAFSAGRG